MILDGSAASPLFARLWATHNVAPPRPCDKMFRYAGIGEISMRSTMLEVGNLPGNRLVVYTPKDDLSGDRLAALRARSDASSAPVGNG